MNFHFYHKIIMLPIILLAGLFIFIPVSFAALNLELTQGVDTAIPIALVPFTGSGAAAEQAKQLTDIIKADLNNSGRFNILDAKSLRRFPHNANNINFSYWKKTGADDLIIGNVQPTKKGLLNVNFSIIDVYRNANSTTGVLIQKSFQVKTRQIRSLAHHLSDIIFQKLTGVRGIFSTRIAYVLVKRNLGKPTQYMLIVSDYDGYNAKPILISKAPIMSPAWSPNGRQLAYVSFEDQRAQIYVSNVRTGKRRLIARYPGINSAPAWSPDGKKLALVLSKSGNVNLYIYDLASRKLTQLTDDNAINTGPNWAPLAMPKDSEYYDSIMFTSDRGGSPQIYDINLASKDIQRITYDGNYNASPKFTPDGKNLVLLHRRDGMYNIAMLNLETGTLRELTKSGFDSSPSIAPNGKMVLFGSRYSDQGVLGIVSTDSRVTLRLPAQSGDVQDPAWSPFLG